MKTKIITRFLPEAEYAEWNRLVALSPEGSIYSTPEYLDVLCSVTQANFRVLVAERNGEMLGGVALYKRHSVPGTHVSPRLLLYYNGIVLRPSDSRYPSEQTARQVEVLLALEEALHGVGCGRVILRNRSTFQDSRVFQARGWEAWPTHTYVVSIGDLASQWTRVEQNLRRLIQRCGREGIQFSDDDDFESFFRMHRQTHERKGVTLYLPPDTFRRFFERLKAQGLCRIFQARMPDGRSISAQLVLLGTHPVSHSVCAGAEPEFLKLGATAFLRWKGFEELSRLGYKANDLTDAFLNSVTHFKSQLGGSLETCLNLRRPESPAFRVERTATTLARLVRFGAGAMAKRLGIRGAA